MASNAYLRILTFRSYNIPFTILIISFILQGFHVDLLSSSIPSTRLIDVGETHFVLRYAFTSFLWLIFIFAQFLFTNLVYWNFLKNPFTEFLNLCSKSNSSVYIRLSSFFGVLIKGIQFNQNVEEDMANLGSKLNSDPSENETGEISKHQVFEVYLSQSFREHLSSGTQYSKDLAALKESQNDQYFKSASVSVQGLSFYESFNQYLKNFFAKSTNEFPYEIKVPTTTEKIFGSDSPSNKSILLAQSNSGFKCCFIYGIQWTIFIFYIFLYTGVEIHTHRPTVAALVVYLVDLIVLAFFVKLNRSNLAKKALLDNRLISS